MHDYVQDIMKIRSWSANNVGIAETSSMVYGCVYSQPRLKGSLC